MTRFTEAGLVPIPAPSTATPGSSWFKITAESRCFEGHFQGAPILPGVAHLAMALSAYSLESGTARVLTGVRAVRFNRPLEPGDEVEIVLTEGKQPSSVRFEIRRHGEPVTVGLLIFQSDDDVSRP